MKKVLVLLLGICLVPTISFSQKDKKGKKSTTTTTTTTTQTNTTPTGPTWAKNENNLEYLFHKNVEGPNAKIGELVDLHYVMKSANGQELKSTYKAGKSTLFPVKMSVFPGDIYEAVSLMSEGDSATFKIPADSMYNQIFKQPLPASVEKGSKLLFTFKIKAIKSQINTLKDAYVKDSLRKAELKVTLENQKKIDDEKIKVYLKTKNLSMEGKSTSGLYFQVYNPGKGADIIKGKTVTFEYETKLLDGTLVESSVLNGGEPSYFNFGYNEVIPGIEEGIQKIKEGGEILLIIPSHLAYSYKEKAKIPPYSCLVMNIKIKSVK